MTKQQDIKEKILKGCRLAVERLLEKKRKDGSYIVVSDNGKVVRVKATDLKNKL